MRTRFLQFIVDTETRQLLSDGTEIHLSPKAFDLLCVLLSRRPNVVGKEELLRQVWPKSFVEEANLNVLIGEVRRAVNDNAQSPRCIRTVHGVGYAFCGSVVDDESMPTKRVPRTKYWLTTKDRQFPLNEGENIIGRDPSCAVW